MSLKLFRRHLSSTVVPPRRRGRIRPRVPSPSSSISLEKKNDTLDHFNAPLYSLKAFAIATTIVVSSAAASVAGVMAYLNVQDTTEFAARMRTWVSQSMPLLTTKIYRLPTARDFTPSDEPVLLQRECVATPTAFDHDAAQQRLAEAFDKGGFNAWAEAVAKEMEAEIEIERWKRRK